MEELIEETTVEREIVVEADHEEAWRAISEPALLEEWLADEVDMIPVEGSDASFVIDDEERPAVIDRVEEGDYLSFTWEREPGRPSLVELQLTPSYRGTRVTVRETDLGGAGGILAMSWRAPLARLGGLRVPAFA